MASVALGSRLGVAKKANLTVVKADIHSPRQGKIEPLIWIDDLKQVYDDVKAHHKGRTVVSMSWGFNNLFDRDPDNVKRLMTALKDMFVRLLNPLIGDRDTPVLIAAGNNAHPPPKPVDNVPAVLAALEIPTLIVVGGVGTDGEWVGYYQEAAYVRVYAPADDVVTASSETGCSWRVIDGTSAATAMTAGLVAYFMARDGKGEANARSVLNNSAYPRPKKHARVEKTPPVLCNKIDSDQI